MYNRIKISKYLGMKLTKEVKDLYCENCRTLAKRLHAVDAEGRGVGGRARAWGWDRDQEGHTGGGVGRGVAAPGGKLQRKPGGAGEEEEGIEARR